MQRCHYSCLELADDTAYVLDLSVAHGQLRELRKQLATLERLVRELGEADRIELHFAGHRTRVVWRKRVVSEAVAVALQARAPEIGLFRPWSEWNARRAAKASKNAKGSAVKVLEVDEGGETAPPAADGDSP